MNHERLADAAAGAGWAFWIIAHAMDWMPVAQFLSFVAATVASVAAAVYYLRKHRNE